eukprot:2602971-Pyramimonas_sp.AAC.1
MPSTRRWWDVVLGEPLLRRRVGIVIALLAVVMPAVLLCLVALDVLDGEDVADASMILERVPEQPPQ